MTTQSKDKTCIKCGIDKPRYAFHNDRSRKDNKYPWCKSCKNKYNVEQKRKAHKKDYRPALIRAAKYRAKKKGLPFNISADDLELIDVCPVLGIKIYTAGLNNQNAPSIDRCVPDLGYVRGNVNIISRRANTLKGDVTVKEAEKILHFIKRATRRPHNEK